MADVSSWHVAQPANAEPADYAPGLDLAEVVETLTRRWILVAGALAAGIVAAVMLHAMLPAPFVARASLLIDPRGLQIMDKDVTARPSTSEQSLSLIESEMRVIVSDTVLRRAIVDRNLTEDFEFNSAKPGLIGSTIRSIRGMLGYTEDVRAAAISAENRALVTLQKAVKIRREPQSFVVELSVSTKDAQKSQAIAAAILSAYTETQHQTMAKATQRAAESLNDRLSEMRKRLENAEKAVESYQATHGIITTQSQGSQPRLIDEQAIAELTTQLATVRADTSRAAARLDMMTKAHRSPEEISAMPEAVLSPAMVFLRNQHSTQRQRIAALSGAVLPAHPAMRNAKQELQEIERGLRQELALMLSSAQLDLDRARDNERQLEQRIETLKGSVTTTNGRLIKLRELEREAEAERAVFASFLNRGRELSEQQSLDSRFAVVISPPVAPASPSSFPLLALVVIGAIAGGAAGSGFALWSDFGSSVLRSARRFSALSGVSDIQIIGGLGSRRAQAGARVLADPSSTFSNAIIKLADQLNAAGRLHDGASVFVTAAQASWAKSEIALNLALAEAAAGKRVLLVDADTSSRVLTKHFAADNLAGLTDELAGAEAPWVTDSTSGLTFIAAGTRQAPGDSARNGAAVREWLDVNGQGFDLVVIDGPSAASDLSAGNWAAPAWATLLVLHENLTRKDIAMGTFERLDRVAPRRVTVALATN